jgi:hypothetical protein
MSFSGDGVRAEEPVVFPSKRLKASPNFPARMFFVPDKEVRLERLICCFAPLSFFLLSESSMVRRNSTLDSMAMSSWGSILGETALADNFGEG